MSAIKIPTKQLLHALMSVALIITVAGCIPEEWSEMTIAYSLDNITYSDESITLVPEAGITLQTEFQVCGQKGTKISPLSFELISEPGVAIELTHVEMRKGDRLYTAHGAHSAIAAYDNKQHTTFWFNGLECDDLAGTELELFNVKINEQSVANIHVWVRYTQMNHVQLMRIPDGIPH